MNTKSHLINPILRWREKNPELYQEKKLAGIRNSQKIKIAARQVALKYGKKASATRMAMPKFQKGEQHVRACVWRLRSPRNAIYEFKNLAEFVRNHGNLFDVKDVQWRRSGFSDVCNAKSGLSALKPHRSDGAPKQRVRGSWKGWRWYASKDVEEKLC